MDASSHNQDREGKPKPKKGQARLHCEGSVLLYDGIPVQDMLAYPVAVAAALIGVCYETFRTEVEAKRIRMTPLKLVPRSEIQRYLDAQLPPLPKS